MRGGGEVFLEVIRLDLLEETNEGVKEENSGWLADCKQTTNNKQTKNLNKNTQQTTKFRSVVNTHAMNYESSNSTL